MQPPLEEHHFELALSNGITRVLLHQRYYQSNWPIERATTEPVNVKLPSEHKPYIAVAQANGIVRTTYLTRVSSGMSKEEASTKEVVKRGRPAGTHRTDRPYTPEQLALAESNGISRQALNGRLKRNWDLERAITEPPLEFWQRNTGEKAQVFVSRKQRTPRKTKQEKWAEQYKALEEYGKKLHDVCHGRDSAVATKRDRLDSKLNRERNGMRYISDFDPIVKVK
ncbi:hypothetical protein COJ25_17260 [Bacillus cereus]|nr:hypothetical protein COJ25_17260 [Bacillus cereus]